MADALRREQGLDVEVVDGGRGEFSVAVNGRKVAQKGDSMPTEDEVRDAIRKAVPAGTA